MSQREFTEKTLALSGFIMKGIVMVMSKNW